jgi:hypothetical protein
MRSAADFTELTGLLALLCDGDFGQPELDRLERLLLDDPDAQRYYARFLALDEELAWSVAGPSESPILEPRPRSQAEAAEDEGGWDGTPTTRNQSLPIPSPADLGMQVTPFPSLAFPDDTIHGTVGHFSSGWPVAYLVATLILGVGLLVGDLVHVSKPVPIANNLAPPTRSVVDPKTEYVGRITGMVDCQWGRSPESRAQSPVLAPHPSALVSLGSTFALASGLMEITYDTGAKVILQGPVTYEVDSPAGGYLSVGKLSARVEKRSEIRDQKSPDLWPRTSDLFAIRTPTITVTDLGTEFDVDVQHDGVVEVNVIQGAVETARHDTKGNRSVKDRIVAGEAFRFATADAPPQRMANRPTSSVSDMLPAISKVRRSPPLRPSNIVASAYHRIGSSTGARRETDDRQQAFKIVTDSVAANEPKEGGPRNGFDTMISNRGESGFVGLLYDRRVRIDRIKLCLGQTLGDQRTWKTVPRAFILKNPVDTNQTPPEDDPANWRELPLQKLYGQAFDDKSNADASEVLEFVLTTCSNEDRSGYGWAVGGVPAGGSPGDVLVSRLLGFGVDAAGKSATRGGVTRKSVMADFQLDWYDKTPLGGWSYLVNTNGPIGHASDYVSLTWNMDRNWYSASPTAWPVAGVAGTAYIYKNPSFPDRCVACPGQGLRNQAPGGSAFPGYAIACYEVQAGQEGLGRIINSLLMLRDWKLPDDEGVVLSDGVDLLVYVNDTLKKSISVNNTKTVDFNCDLGTLMAGDKVYVALGPGVGPDKADYFDGTDLGYQIEAAPVQEPTTSVLFGAADGKPRVSPSNTVTK